MNNVKILTPETVAKIAAGEVIERPASAVKELIENALDAGTTDLRISLKSAGKSSIRIRDNGSGIAKDDLALIGSRHATSKISDADDLYAVKTLGFRGEALYSIAAVSDLTIDSRTAGSENGWQLHLRAAERQALKPVAMNQGTQIEVQELFFNTPARKKFLKSNAAELREIMETVVPYALLDPALRMELIHESRTLLDLQPAPTLIERIAQTLNLDRKSILEDRWSQEEEQISLHAILGDINIQRTRKDMQFVFVNGRPVTERTVSFHVNEIYRLLLSPGIYPFFCIYVSMPADQLDVNVHPAKREVRLKDPLRLIQMLRPLCERLLMTRGKARQPSVFTIPGPSHQAQSPDASPATGQPPAQHQYALTFEESMALFKTEARENSGGDLREKLRQARYVGSLLKKYLLFETDDSLLVLDQHAAQERIVFEKLLAAIEAARVEVQRLLHPLLLKLSPPELVFWDQIKDRLADAGFETSLFDPQTLAVHSHPAEITNPEAAVRAVLADQGFDIKDREALSRRACRGSVMAGFSMNKEQAEYQRQALLAARNPFICPHGRPTAIEITDATLIKLFLRT